MDKRDLLPIGQVAARSGVSVPTLRFYEDRGLIASVRNSSNHRRYERHVLRRIAVIRAGQHAGMSLAEIGEALGSLPHDRPPTGGDWRRLSNAWRDDLDRRIEAMTAVRDKLTSCIGCGCLSLKSCPISNPDDRLAARGPGARYLPEAART